MGYEWYAGLPLMRVRVDGFCGVQNSAMLLRMLFVCARGTAVATAEASPNEAPHDRVVFVESNAVLVGAWVVEGAGGIDVVLGTGTAEGWMIRLPAGAAV